MFIRSGPIVVSQRSRFQGHFARIQDANELSIVLSNIKAENKKMKSATHQILAYRLKNGEGGKDDDGEGGAGERLLTLLEKRNLMDIVVVVTRWYGGVKLGGERFRIITTCIKDLLDEHKL